MEKNIDDADTNAFRYCGEYYDAETATIYLRARYYDPSNGRLTQRDSFAGKQGDPLSLNLYTYCGNNPIVGVDPSGHIKIPKWVKDVAIAGVGKGGEVIGSAYKKRVFDPMYETGGKLNEDFYNYDKWNTDEGEVLKSNYFSSYKGQFVVRTPSEMKLFGIKPFERAFSFGVMGIPTNKKSDDYNLVKHEYGHYIQLQELGVFKYTFGIAIPSAFSDSPMDYYSRPWEVTADMFGEVDRTHTPGSEFLGQLYFETMKNYPDPIYLERPRPPMPVPSYPFLP